jgi:hypothetical protein
MSDLRVRQHAAASAFPILSVLLLPVALLGYLIWVGKTCTAGASGTAQGSLVSRALLALGESEDHGR